MVVIKETGPEMFWGLTLDEGKRYTQTVKASFRISMAAIEPTSGSKDVTSVYLKKENQEFLLCSLQQGSHLQQQLDLGFLCGESLTLFTTGKGTVHLTGYRVYDEDLLYPQDSEDESGLSDALEDEEEPEPALKKSKLQISNKSGGAGDASADKSATFENLVFDGSDSDDDDYDMEDEDEEDEEDDDDDDDLEDNFLDSMADEDEDSDEEDEGEEEDEDDSDDSEEMSEEEVKRISEEIRKKLMKEESAKKGKKDMNGHGTAKTPEAKKLKTEQKTSKTPDQKSKQQSSKTPQQSSKTPQQSSKTPQQSSKTPQQSSKTPQQTQKGKTAQQSAKTPQGKTPQQTKEPVKTPKQNQQTKTPQKRKLPSGVTLEELKEGHGPEAKSNKMVHVYYTGKLTSGKVFDSTTSGKPFKFRLGKNEVIKGWELGLQGMKVGGKRRLTIPPNLAYGNDKSSGLPPNSTLLFDVELKAIS